MSTAADVRRAYRVHGAIGHSGALQTASRLARRHVGPDGTVYAAGTAIPQRADFNTLDNPFAWSADGSASSEPAAGVHFVVFNPTSDDFHRVRRAMDGELPDGTTLPFEPRAEGQGFNSILARRGGRTSSSRRACTARSRSPSSVPEPRRLRSSVVADSSTPGCRAHGGSPWRIGGAAAASWIFGCTGLTAGRPFSSGGIEADHTCAASPKGNAGARGRSVFARLRRVAASRVGSSRT